MSSEHWSQNRCLTTSAIIGCTLAFAAIFIGIFECPPIDGAQSQQAVMLVCIFDAVLLFWALCHIGCSGTVVMPFVWYVFTAASTGATLNYFIATENTVEVGKTCLALVPWITLFVVGILYIYIAVSACVDVRNRLVVEKEKPLETLEPAVVPHDVSGHFVIQ